MGLVSGFLSSGSLLSSLASRLHILILFGSTGSEGKKERSRGKPLPRCQPRSHFLLLWIHGQPALPRVKTYVLAGEESNNESGTL